MESYIVSISQIFTRQQAKIAKTRLELHTNFIPLYSYFLLRFTPLLHCSLNIPRPGLITRFYLIYDDVANLAHQRGGLIFLQ